MNGSKITEVLEQIAQKLTSSGEISSPYRYQNHIHQGHNSQVFILSSEEKELVVHLAKPFDHYFVDKTWEKLLVISMFLREETRLPIPRIIFAEPQQEFIVIVQEKLPGDIAGTATVSDHQVVYSWLQNKPVLIPQIQKMVAGIHSISVSGYGVPVEKSGKLIATCVTWEEFLRQRISMWLNALKAKKSLRTLEKNLYLDIQAYAELAYSMIPASEGSLTHGDLGNPSNILGQHNKVTGIIDWEFSLISDAAWEFCDEGWVETIQETGLKDYFQARNIGSEKQREEFLRRIILYRPLQCLMWLYVHRNDAEPMIFDTCVALLQKDLIEAKKQW